MKFLYLVIFSTVIACTKVNFTAGTTENNQQSATQPTYPTTPPQQCAGTIEKTTENLRIIFMVDNSGSTLETDPSQLVRVQTIRDFLAKYQSKINFTYSFGYFSDETSVFNTTTQKFQSSSVPQNVFGTAVDIAQALKLFTKVSPNGATNYEPALTAVQSMIVQDPHVSTPWNYVLIFMSDGQPTDINDPVVPTLEGLVTNVLNAATSHGDFATSSMVLFDPIDDPQYRSSLVNLSSMATKGKGQFFDTNFPPPGGLAIDDIISVPGQTCQ